MDVITQFFTSLPFSKATWFTLSTLAFFVWLLARSSKNPNSPVKWEHLIIDSDNNRTSPYKLGYLIGLVVGTWIVIRLADLNQITFDIFGLYLTYLLGGAGFNSFIRSRSGGYASSEDDASK